MTVIHYMSIDRADKPWIGDRRFTEIGEIGPPPVILGNLRASAEGGLRPAR